MQVSAPASSANLGAGFDCLALAVDLRFRLSDEPHDGLIAAEDTHPAVIAYREAGGPAAQLWWRSPIPPGAGLGFSGAARAAGAALGCIASGSVSAGASAAVEQAAFEVAARLEAHPENAAASAFGGFVVCVENSVFRPALASGDLVLVTWTPAAQTSSTDRARRGLPESVPMAAAVHNLGATAAMVVGLLTGDQQALRLGASDLLHQDHRLAALPASAHVLAALERDDRVLSNWLSGSGPTVAALVGLGEAEGVAGSLPGDGVTRVLGIDSLGVVVS